MLRGTQVQRRISSHAYQREDASESEYLERFYPQYLYALGTALAFETVAGHAWTVSLRQLAD